MEIINIDSVKAQDISFNYNEVLYELSFTYIKGNLLVTIRENHEITRSNIRVVINAPLLPVNSPFNFVIYTDNDEDLAQDRLGKTQRLLAYNTEENIFEFNFYTYQLRDLNAISSK